MFCPPIIHQHHTVQPLVRRRARLPTPEVGLPWQLCAAVTMATTAVGGGLLCVPLEGYRGGRAGSGLTLGLTQVPATHLGIAGQELCEE